MPRKTKKSSGVDETTELRQQIARLEELLVIRQRVAFAAGLFQGDVTVRTLIESLTEGLIVIDAEGRIILVNQRAEEIFGYSSAEVVGQLLAVLLPEKLIRVHAHHVQTYFQEPRLRPIGQGLELSARRKDGTEFPVEIGLGFLDTQAGQWGLAFVTDITLRKQAERALQEQNEALDAFAHTVAHDLQASLTILMGLSQYLAETHATMSGPELREHLLDLARTGQKMSNIITELLLFANMRQEEVMLVLLEMAPIVEAALNRLYYAIEEAQAQIILPASYPRALGYAPWVEEVWFNYLSNALKYGGHPPRVEIGGTVQANGEVKFWVKDNGVGLTEAEQAQLFKPGQRLEQQWVPGHGLGLSIVQRIVERLNGSVGVESEVGKGSMFSFTLPGPDKQTSGMQEE